MNITNVSMKDVALKVVMRVPDDYIVDEPLWDLEDAFINNESVVEIVSVSTVTRKN